MIHEGKWTVEKIIKPLVMMLVNWSLVEINQTVKTWLVTFSPIDWKSLSTHFVGELNTGFRIYGKICGTNIITPKIKSLKEA